MLVNCRGQLDIAQALAIPYLNAKLAIGYPSLGLLVTFHNQWVKAHQENNQKHWKEHGDSYLEWLSNLNNGTQGDVQVVQAIQDSRVGTDVPALEDGQVDEEDSQLIEMQDQGSQRKGGGPEESGSQQEGAEPPAAELEEGQKKDKVLEEGQK